MSRMTTLLGAAALIAMAGCERDRDRLGEGEIVPEVEPTPIEPAPRIDEPPTADEPSPGAARAPTGAATENRAAISRITSARCDREQRCNNVGAGLEYSSMAECQTTIQADWREDLREYECPAGIDQDELEECVEEIESEDCNRPLDTLGRVVACRSSDICLNVAEQY